MRELPQNPSIKWRGIFILLTICWSLVSAPAKAATRDLLIFAAASTANALNAALGHYAKETGLVVRASYASSGALARQIDHGAPAALFLSANADWIKWLDGRARLAPGTRKILLGNRLILIEPARDKGITLPIHRNIAGNILRNPRRALAMANPEHVPAGAYARDALKSLGLWDVAASMAVRARDVRAAFLLVERGEAGLGIVYKTDVRNTSKVLILNTFPKNSHPAIEYELAIVKDQDNLGARRLYNFLQSKPAMSNFSRFGFITDPIQARRKIRIDRGLPDSH